MPKPETITMTMRELDRLKVIQAVVDHGLAVWRAAEKLGLSRRQVERLVLRYREDGPSGLGSRKRGRDSNRQLPPGLESRVRGLIRDTYADFGPTLACECASLPRPRMSFGARPPLLGQWRGMH